MWIESRSSYQSARKNNALTFWSVYMPLILNSINLTVIYFTAFGAPRNVISTPLSDSLTLSWNEPDNGGGARSIRDYNVEWESGAFNGEFQVTDTSAQINDLQPNTRYNVNVSVITNRNEKGFPAILDVVTRKLILFIF